MSPAEDFLRDEKLRNLYANTAGPVAFVDESYNQHRDHGYYTMTGVMFARERLVEHRRRFITIGAAPGTDGWHTTDAYHSERHGQIIRFVEAIAQRAEWTITTVETPLAGTSRTAMERARADCLESLLREFSRGPGGARVFVLDRLDERGMSNDVRLASRLVRDGQLPPQIKIRHSTSADEALLDAPDTISWAARRLLVAGETRWIEKAQDVVSIVHLATGEHLNVPELIVKHNSAGAASAEHPAPDLEQRSRVPYSPLLLDPVSHEGPTPSTAQRVESPMQELAARARQLRERARQAPPARPGTPPDEIEPPELAPAEL